MVPLPLLVPALGVEESSEKEVALPGDGLPCGAGGGGGRTIGILGDAVRETESALTTGGGRAGSWATILGSELELELSLTLSDAKRSAGGFVAGFSFSLSSSNGLKFESGLLAASGFGGNDLWFAAGGD